MLIKKYIPLILLALIAPLAMSSCSEEDDIVDEFPNWQATNEAFVDHLTDSVNKLLADNPLRTDWKRLKSWSKLNSEAGTNADYILVKVLESSQEPNASKPLYTDSVAVHYQGSLLPSTSYTEGYPFDPSYYGNSNPELGRPTKMKRSELIDAFGTAVLNMQRRDRWLVYIPYQLGYGASSSNSAVPSYSTLVFDIALADFY